MVEHVATALELYNAFIIIIIIFIMIPWIAFAVSIHWIKLMLKGLWMMVFCLDSSVIKAILGTINSKPYRKQPDLIEKHHFKQALMI